MKKKFLSGGVTILALLTLVACGVPADSSSSGISSGQDSSSSSSSSSESSSSSSSSSSQTTSDWTTAQKSVMSAHLNGYIMPYISLHADTTVLWYEDYECISIESKKSATSKVVEYKNILTSVGFKFEYDSEWQSWDGFLTQSDGNEIEVNIYSFDEYNFICDIYYYEPIEYLTSWPTEEIKDYLGADAVIPSINADNYYYDTTYEGYGFHIIYVIDGAGLEDSYAVILELNNWTVEGGDGYYTAQNQEETIEIQFYSDADNLVILIYATEPHQAWPQEELEDFLGDLLNSSNGIPVFETDLSFTFQIFEDETVDEEILADWFYIGLSDDSLTVENSEDVYKTLLENNGYAIDDSQYDTLGYIAISSDKAIYIQFFYWEGEFKIFIIGYDDFYLTSEYDVWPAELVADFVDNDSIVVPSASGESFIVSFLGGMISISIPTEDGAAAIFNYEALLITNGWTVTDHVAINAGEENSEIKITVSLETIAGQTNLVIVIEDYIIPLPDGVFDFRDENQLITKSPDIGVWKSGPVTMTVTRNTAIVGVGGDWMGFFSNPLRLYIGQQVTITSAEQNITSIVFVASSTSYANDLAAATWTNATAVVSGTTVTVTPTTPTNTISFTLVKQARIFDATVNLA